MEGSYAKVTYLGTLGLKGLYYQEEEVSREKKEEENIGVRYHERKPPRDQRFKTGWERKKGRGHIDRARVRGLGSSKAKIRTIGN